jgi:hypothetical protein
MSWVQTQLDDESMFPSKIGTLNVPTTISMFLSHSPVVSRHSFSQELSANCQKHLQAPISRLCAPVSFSLSENSRVGRRGTFEYLFQGESVVVCVGSCCLGCRSDCFSPSQHFYFFVQEFGLVDKKDLAPLQELIDQLK